MTSVTATAARKDIYNLIARVNEDCKPVAITNSKGKGAVLVGEDDWSAIEETLYILAYPAWQKSLSKRMTRTSITASPLTHWIGNPCTRLSLRSRRPKTRRS